MWFSDDSIIIIKFCWSIINGVGLIFLRCNFYGSILIFLYCINFLWSNLLGGFLFDTCLIFLWTFFRDLIFDTCLNFLWTFFLSNITGVGLIFVRSNIYGSVRIFLYRINFLRSNIFGSFPFDIGLVFLRTFFLSNIFDNCLIFLSTFL